MSAQPLRVILAAVALASCAGPPKPSPVAAVTPDPAPPQAKGPWALVARGRLAEAYVERVLYEKPGAAHFFVHGRVVSRTSAELGLRLDGYFDVLYVNQWGASDSPHRGAIDETRLPVRPLDDATRAQLLAGFPAMRRVPAGGTVDYYRDFNASTRADVDAQSRGQRYVLLVMDGHLDVTDGKEVDRIVTPADDAAREIAVEVPVTWREMPAGATVLADR